MIPSPRITTPSNSVRFTPPTQDGLDDSGASGLVSLKRPALTPPDQDHSASRHHWLTVPRRHPTSRATAAADSPATTRATASRCTPRSNRASPRHKTLLQQVVHPPPEPAVRLVWRRLVSMRCVAGGCSPFRVLESVGAVVPVRRVVVPRAATSCLMSCGLWWRRCEGGVWGRSGPVWGRCCGRRSLFAWGRGRCCWLVLGLGFGCLVPLGRRPWWAVGRGSASRVMGPRVGLMVRGYGQYHGVVPARAPDVET